jgi:hypothetical protein
VLDLGAAVGDEVEHRAVVVDDDGFVGVGGDLEPQRAA